MKESGHLLSLRHPLDYSFYRKLGWETYAEYKSYEVGSAVLPALFNVTDGFVERTENWKRVNYIYQQYEA